MKCDEALEFVSAICDGEVVTREAAEHLTDCAECKQRMLEYLAMGAELRCFASMQVEEQEGSFVRNRRSRMIPTLWQKGWATMRIPRFAFAAMIVGMLVLACSLVKVRVGAHSEGTVVMLKVTMPDGTSGTCPLPTLGKHDWGCASVASAKGKWIGYSVDVESRQGNRVQLGVRTKVFSESAASFSTVDLKQEPLQSMWFEPGETLKVNFPGVGDMVLTGEWTDHVPASIGDNEATDPAPDELRVVSPLLVRNNSVEGDMEGGSAIAKNPDEAIDLSLPHHGRYIFSLSPMKNAVQGHVKFNRVTFQTADGSYTLITGAPVSRSKEIWVRQEANAIMSNGGIGEGKLSALAPEAVLHGTPSDQ